MAVSPGSSVLGNVLSAFQPPSVSTAVAVSARERALLVAFMVVTLAFNVWATTRGWGSGHLAGNINQCLIRHYPFAWQVFDTGGQFPPGREILQYRQHGPIHFSGLANFLPHLIRCR